MGRSGAASLQRIRREEPRPASEGGPYKPVWARWSSVELAARRAAGSFALALIRLFGFFGVVAALFAAADAAMGPQTFENHFGGGRGGASVLAILNAEFADVFHQALNF